MRSPRFTLRGFAWITLPIAAAAVAAAWWWQRPVRWTDPVEPPPPLRDSIARFAAGKSREAEELARACLRRYDAPAWEGRLRVMVATRMAEAGDLSRVLEILPRPLPPNEPLAPYADLLRSRGLLARGDAEGSVAAALRASATPGFPLADEAARAEADALARTGRKSAAIARLDRETSAELRLAAARAARDGGDVAGARRRLVAIVLDASGGAGAERALDEMCALFPEPSTRFRGGERSRLSATARRWADAGRLESALALLRSARPAGSSSASAPPAEAILEADLLLRLGRTAEAAPTVLRISKIGGPAAAEAVYLSGRIARARGRLAEWRATLRELASRPSAGRWRLAALLDLARAEEGTPARAALDAYRRYRLAAGETAEPGALWREAWAAFELGRLREAKEGIARVLARRDAVPAIRAAALYWSGRILEGEGATDLARARFREAADLLPSHYYGMLAHRRTGGAEPVAQERPASRATDPADPRARRWLAAARALSSIGFPDAAADAYRATARPGTPGDRSIAIEGADAALAAGLPAEALALLETASIDRDTADPGILSLRHLRLLAPLPLDRAIASAARSASLDPSLVAAIALQESGFNPLAVSSAGARGLLQVLPSTGADLARRIGLVRFRPEQLFDPEVNLRLGCAYFRDLRDRLGSVPVALAAYNAGPSRAARWRTPDDDPAGERYVERIPFLETRGYVKRILANERLYRMAWHGTAPGP